MTSISKTKSNAKAVKLAKSELFKGYVEYPDTSISRGLFYDEKKENQYVITLNGQTACQKRLDKRLIKELKDLKANVEILPVSKLRGITRFGNVPVRIKHRPKTVTEWQNDGTSITLKKGDIMVRVDGKSISEIDFKIKTIQTLVVKAVGATLPLVHKCWWTTEIEDTLTLLDDSEIPPELLPANLKPVELSPINKDEIIADLTTEVKRLHNKLEDKQDDKKTQIQTELRKSLVAERRVKSDVLK